MAYLSEARQTLDFNLKLIALAMTNSRASGLRPGNSLSLPSPATPWCGAKWRDRLPCQKPRAKGRTRCRLHGGAQGSGAPRGEANGRYSHGLLTAEAIEERNALMEILETGVK